MRFLLRVWDEPGWLHQYEPCCRLGAGLQSGPLPAEIYRKLSVVILGSSFIISVAAADMEDQNAVITCNVLTCKCVHVSEVRNHICLFYFLTVAQQSGDVTACMYSEKVWTRRWGGALFIPKNVGLLGPQRMSQSSPSMKKYDRPSLNKTLKMTFRYIFCKCYVVSEWV